MELWKFGCDIYALIVLCVRWVCDIDESDAYGRADNS